MAKKPAPSGPLSPACRVVVLAGKESFLLSEYTAQLREMLAKEHGEVDTVRFDGAAAQLADILDECRTLGLMQQHKLVLVDNADLLLRAGDDEEGEGDARGQSRAGNRALMERYAQAPCAGATLVLRAGRWYPGKLDELVSRVGVVKKCEAVEPAFAAEWAVKRAEKRHNATLDPTAAAALVERVGADLARLDSELAKLAVSASRPDGKPAAITPALVAELVGQTREDEFWAIQRTLLAGHPEAAIAHIRQILENARSDMSVPLTWAAADLARKLHAASHGLRQGMNPFALGGKLKLWPEDRREAVLTAARRADPRRLAALLKSAVEADAAGKSGLGDPARTLERLALEFADALGQGAPAGA